MATSLEQFAKYHAEKTITLRNQIATANDDLAKEIARRWSHRCDIPFEDLLQQGRIGLLRGIERFDPKRGFAFSSFVVPFIQGEIQHFLRDYAWDLGKVPRDAIELNSRVRRSQRYWQDRGQSLAASVVAKSLGVSPTKWAEVEELTARHPLVDIDQAGLIPAQETASERVLQLRRAIASLPNPYRAAIRMAYLEDTPVPAIAEQMGAAPAQVQQWIDQGVERLRAKLETLEND